MRSRHGVFGGSSSLLARVGAALAVVVILGGCASLGPEIPPPPRATLEFDNQSPEPVRVYLVLEEGGAYLLGRVYPLQTNSLRLPRHLPIEATRRASLVVVPLAANGFAQAPRGPFARQIVAPLAELAMQRYVITPAALHGSFWSTRTLR